MDRLTTYEGSVKVAGLHPATGATYSIDDACLSESELMRAPDSSPLDALPAYFVDVSDTSRVHQHQIEVTAADGELFTYEGDVVTVGNDPGGEFRRPTMLAQD